MIDFKQGSMMMRKKYSSLCMLPSHASMRDATTADGAFAHLTRRRGGSNLDFRSVINPLGGEYCHVSNLFGTFLGNSLPCLLNRFHPSLVKAADTFTLEFESVENIGKIGEESYNIVPIDMHDSTQASRLRSAERSRLLIL
ncbi:hypothetical protein AVEN_223840-1 [Araneus ventricosus]|uniref:Uncharacterized protein n=1 Tax=Araneus ventricosus TaxID=182803 RepID=A0A4Y2FI10_ARAVE|nr:hypothetical protein AVEN_223840-1 [Araneus ventricosus]